MCKTNYIERGYLTIMHISKQSAGILLYRNINGYLEVFLVHPGGPFFKNKDEGSWSVPKGEYLEDEDPLLAAKREFTEETGKHLIDGNFIELKPVKLKSGKTVKAWAVEGDMAPNDLVSNFFEMEWPPRTGKMASFVEVDRGDWFDVDAAKRKINPAQVGLVEELVLLV